MAQRSWLGDVQIKTKLTLVLDIVAIISQSPTNNPITKIWFLNINTMATD